MTDKLTDVFEALKRGERPNCPRCNAELKSIKIRIGIEGRQCYLPGDSVKWKCESEINSGTVNFERSHLCLLRELAALRAEIVALKTVMEDAANKCDIYSLEVKEILETALASDLGSEDRDDRIGTLKGYMRDVLAHLEAGNYSTAIKYLKYALAARKEDSNA